VDEETAARSKEPDDGIDDFHGADRVEEPSRADRPTDAKSNDDARHLSSRKRSRSTSEDGEVGSEQWLQVPSSRDLADVVTAVAEIADKSVPKMRCTWVQSQREMSEHDLTMIFSHFGHLERVEVPRPRSGRMPFAFVHFKNEEDAKSTIRRAEEGEFGCLTVKPYHSRREEAWQTVKGSSDRWRKAE
jgi:RNA recognition motif-containing protein